MPAAAVTHERWALSVIIGRIGCVDYSKSSALLKDFYLVFMKTLKLSFLEVSDTYKIAMKCIQFIGVIISEGDLLY